MKRSRKAQILAQAGMPIIPLESSENVSRVPGRHHPEFLLVLDLHIRSPD